MRKRDDFMPGQNRLQRAPKLPAGAGDQYFHSALRKSLGLSCNRTYRTYRSYKSYSFIFKPRQDVHQLPQRFRRHIFLRQDRGVNLFERPIDLQVRVVPLNADLALRVVKIVAFVYDLRDLTGHAESVREPGRDVNLSEVFSRQPDADPLPEVWRAAPNVDRHVVDLALDHANQFGLRSTNLRVQPAYRVALRPRMVVLDEDRVNPALLILPTVIGFEEKASLVAEDLRLDNDHTGNVRGNEFHRACAPCSNILSKYLP